VALGKAQRARLICEIKIELRPGKALTEEPAIAKKQTKKQLASPADQFTDQEMRLVKNFGAALGGAPTPFDEEVEAHLARHEEHHARLRDGQTDDSTED
jgi:hypothetical protein